MSFIGDVQPYQYEPEEPPEEEEVEPETPPASQSLGEWWVVAFP